MRRVGIPAPRNLTEKITFVEAELLAKGLPIKPSSRLGHGRECFGNPGGETKRAMPDDPRFFDAVEAGRTFSCFEKILECWPFEPSDELAEEKLRVALKDDVDPYAAGGSTPGRDAQMELYVAAMIHKAGLPVSFVRPTGATRTPDLRTSVAGGYCHIEVKRCKSLRSLVRCIKRGAEQIRGLGCPGAIFLDATLALHPQPGFFPPMSDQEFGDHWESKTRLLLNRQASMFEPQLRGGPVGGLVILDFPLRVHPVLGWRAEPLCLPLENGHSNARACRAWKELRRSLNHAW